MRAGELVNVRRNARAEGGVLRAGNIRLKAIRQPSSKRGGLCVGAISCALSHRSQGGVLRPKCILAAIDDRRLSQREGRDVMSRNFCEICQLEFEGVPCEAEINGVVFCACASCVEWARTSSDATIPKLLSEVRAEATRLIELIDANAQLADKAIHFENIGDAPAAMRAMKEFNANLDEISRLRDAIGS